MDILSLRGCAGKEILRKMITIINITPHAIVVDDGEISKTYEPSGKVARVITESTPVGKMDGFEVVSTRVMGDNLPEPQDGVYLIVSAMVMGLRPDRKDLIAPNTGAAKRNEKGHIISVPGFIA
jgi:hypothetical protein